MYVVSDRQFYREQTSRLGANQRRLLGAQGEAISRLRVESTADDPSAASWALETRQELDRLLAQRPNLALLAFEYDSVDRALDDANDVLAEALTCAIGARTATQATSPQQREIWRQKAASLQDRMFQAANTHLRERYLFAGTTDDAAPFDMAGTYAGNAVVRQVEVERGTTLPANVPGDQIFNVAGGENVLGLLADLSADVAGGQWDAIGTDIDRLRAARAQVSLQRTAAGARREQIDAIRARQDRQVESYQSTLADMVEVDEVRSATRLRQAQLDYERGVKATADMLRTLELGV